MDVDKWFKVEGMAAPPGTSPKGNATKYFRYREAWTRIKAACEQGFYFEAVTIQESIIADRLVAYLVAKGHIALPTELSRFPTFANLIRVWKEFHPEPIAAGSFSNLQEEVDRWRRTRNQVVHGIVKSYPGSDAATIEEFLRDVMESARTGVLLAKAISSWSDKVLRQIRKEMA